MLTGLPFRPTVQADESPLSVLRRGALGNHHTSTLRFTFGLHPAIDHAPSGLSTLARDPDMQRDALTVLGIPPTDIDRLVYRRLGRGRSDAIIWNGLQVPIGDLQFRRSKLCVACYRDKGYASCHWDHIAALACPHHRILLDDACPCCGTAWTPETDPLSCGCPINEMIARQVPCSEAVATTLARVVASGDSSSLRHLGAFVKMLQTWMKLGLPLTREQFAEALTALSRNRWPDFPGENHGTPVHPRVALAPLLASPDTVADANRILAQAPVPFCVRQLRPIAWPASTAMAALGIGRAPFEKLLRAGHLAPDNHGQYSAAHLNDLLQWTTGHPEPGLHSLSHWRASKHRRSLASLITSIQRGEITRYYCPAHAGLSGLCCALDTPRHANIAHGVTLKTASSQLQVNSESVRRLIKLGLLSATRGCGDSAVQWVIDPDSLARFQATYVFASALAAGHQLPLRAVIYRLRATGMVPVSGPGIDTGLTFLFRREDLCSIDLSTALMNSTPGAANRRNRPQRTERSDLCFGIDAAALLGLSVRQLRDVVVAGLLTPVSRTRRGQSFAIHDVQALREQLLTDRVPLLLAARRLGQTTAQFQKTWIDTGMVKTYRFGPQRWVERSDLERAQVIWQKSASASAIGQRLGRSRWLCSNLSKMGRITVDSRLGSSPHAVRLFKRTNSTWSRYDLSQPPASISTPRSVTTCDRESFGEPS